MVFPFFGQNLVYNDLGQFLILLCQRIHRCGIFVCPGLLISVGSGNRIGILLKISKIFPEIRTGTRSLLRNINSVFFRKSVIYPGNIILTDNKTFKTMKPVFRCT